MTTTKETQKDIPCIDDLLDAVCIDTTSDSASNVVDVLDEIVERLAGRLNACGALYLWHDGLKRLVLRSTTNWLDRSCANRIAFADGEAEMGTLWACAPRYIDDVQAFLKETTWEETPKYLSKMFPSGRPTDESSLRLITVPLKFSSVQLGIIALYITCNEDVSQEISRRLAPKLGKLSSHASTTVSALISQSKEVWQLGENRRIRAIETNLPRMIQDERLERSICEFIDKVYSADTSIWQEHDGAFVRVDKPGHETTPEEVSCLRAAYKTIIHDSNSSPTPATRVLQVDRTIVPLIDDGDSLGWLMLNWHDESPALIDDLSHHCENSLWELAQTVGAVLIARRNHVRRVQSEESRREASSRLDQFYDSVRIHYHSVRELVNQIVSKCEDLTDASEAQKQISNLALSLQRLLKAKGELGSAIAVPVTTNVNELLEETCSELETVFQQHQIEVRKQLEPATAQVVLPEIQDTFCILLQNAIEALLDKPAGRRKVILTLRAGPSDWQLSVTDTGTGMPPRLLDRIRQGNPIESEGKGGVGLALVSTRVAKEGGTITIHSAEGLGTNVILKFPRN